MKREVDSIGLRTSVSSTTNNPVSIKRFGDRHSEVHLTSFSIISLFCGLFREIGAFAGGWDEKEDKTPEPAFQPNYYGFIPFFLVPSVRMVSWWHHGSIPVISLLFLGLDLRSPGFDCFCSGVLVSAPRLYFLYLGRVRVNGAAHLCDAL